MKPKKVIAAFLAIALSCVLPISDRTSQKSITSVSTSSDVPIVEKASDTQTIDEKLADFIEQANDLDEATVLAQYSDVFGDTPKGAASDYLTPQDFGAVINGAQNDTVGKTNRDAFRKMFKAAYDNGTASGSTRKCKKIFIPYGRYYISGGSIIDESLNVQGAQFEVIGSGREATTLQFSSDVLIKNSYIFGNSLFRDITFLGTNNTNTVMTLSTSKSVYSDLGSIRFVQCGFRKVASIVDSLEPTPFFSELDFVFCKISGFTNCRLFTLNGPKSQQWKFLYTDIESYIGTCFYFKRDTSLYIAGGSFIPTDGSVYYFPKEYIPSPVPSLTPNIFSANTRYEIKEDTKKGTKSSLLCTYSKSKESCIALFKRSSFTTINNHPDIFLNIFGSFNITFDECEALSDMKIKGDLSGSENVVRKLKFLNSEAPSVAKLSGNTSITYADQNRPTNDIHVIMDDKYDFYLTKDGYAHLKSDSDEYRLPVSFTKYDNFSPSSGKTYTVNPYGYVKYVDITVPKHTAYAFKNKTMTITLYNGSTKLGTPATIDFTKGNTYKIDVNAYVKDLNIEFTHSIASSFQLYLDMGIVKASAPDDSLYLLGDINGDGKVSADDAIIAARIAADYSNYSTYYDLKIADINEDGKVTADDAVIIARLSANYGDYKTKYTKYIG